MVYQPQPSRPLYGMSVFQFRSVNFPDHFIRHRDFLGELNKETVGGELGDFSFQLVNRGHDQEGRQRVSLRSVNFPDRYLRHRDFRIHLEGPNGPDDQLFRTDSTFFFEIGLADLKGVSFRSVNFPDRYLRHRDFHLWLEPRDSPNLVPDATFIKTVRID
jgi:alpha-L-arabinofuranosidase B-like protein